MFTVYKNDSLRLLSLEMRWISSKKKRFWPKQKRETEVENLSQILAKAALLTISLIIINQMILDDDSTQRDNFGDETREKLIELSYDSLKIIIITFCQSYLVFFSCSCFKLSWSVCFRLFNSTYSLCLSACLTAY